MKQHNPTYRSHSWQGGKKKRQRVRGRNHGFCVLLKQGSVGARWTAGIWHGVLAWSWCGAVVLGTVNLTGSFLLSVECPVICQMQQLLVSMETTHVPFSVFSSSLCEGKAVEEKVGWWNWRRVEGGLQEEMVAFKERTKWCFDYMFMRGRKSREWGGECAMYEQIYRFTVCSGA